MCVGGHKGPVDCVAIHPTGMLAFSVSRDRSLRLWNLVQGRCSFTRKLRAAANIVKWGALGGVPGGVYMLVMGKEIQVFKTEDNSVVTEVVLDSRVNQADVLTLRDGSYRLLALTESKMVYVFGPSGEFVIASIKINQSVSQDTIYLDLCCHLSAVTQPTIFSLPFSSHLSYSHSHYLFM